jgi:acylphosphatase
MVRRHVSYRGDVQGVGFRFAAMRAARGYAVTGYVRNLPDGRVEIVAEGDPDTVDSFLADVAERLGDHIQSTQVATAPATGEFATFDIRA